MAIYQITDNHFSKIEETTIVDLGIKECSESQRLLPSQAGVISPDTLMITDHQAGSVSKV